MVYILLGLFRTMIWFTYSLVYSEQWYGLHTPWSIPNNDMVYILLGLFRTMIWFTYSLVYSEQWYGLHTPWSIPNKWYGLHTPWSIPNNDMVYILLGLFRTMIWFTYSLVYSEQWYGLHTPWSIPNNDMVYILLGLFRTMIWFTYSLVYSEQWYGLHTPWSIPNKWYGLHTPWSIPNNDMVWHTPWSIPNNNMVYILKYGRLFRNHKWYTAHVYIRVQVIRNTAHRPSTQASYSIGSGTTMQQNEHAAQIAAKHSITPQMAPYMSWIFLVYGLLLMSVNLENYSSSS